jgi:molybdopterin synthase catalytic subunit
VIVRLRLFAMLRERAGSGELELELPDGASVADALAAPRVAALAGDLACVLAVNREYAPPERILLAGDELALIPPVSGGAGDTARIHAAIVDTPLSADALITFASDPRAGALVTFHGVTREVDELHYEAYTEMALAALREIAERAAAAHGLCAAAVEHRVGVVPLSEPSVIVAVSAPHRGEAFAGAREIIDAVKVAAPIWKLEVEAGDRRWVQGTVPQNPADA